MAEFCAEHIKEHEFVYQTHLKIEDAIVILNKFWLQHITNKELGKLRDKNFVVGDPIDSDCNLELDARLSIHSQQPGYYVTHLVDTRIPRDLKVTDKFAIGYYGTLSNTVAPAEVVCVSCYDNSVQVLGNFSAHYTVRRKIKESFKPPLKIWTAAVCNVPVLTSMDNDVPLYLKDYPYVAETGEAAIKVLEQMRQDFGTDKWEEARQMVRATYDDTRVVSDMREFLDGIA